MIIPQQKRSPLNQRSAKCDRKIIHPNKSDRDILDVMLNKVSLVFTQGVTNQ